MAAHRRPAMTSAQETRHSRSSASIPDESSLAGVDRTPTGETIQSPPEGLHNTLVEDAGVEATLVNGGPELANEQPHARPVLVDRRPLTLDGVEAGKSATWWHEDVLDSKATRVSKDLLEVAIRRHH